MKNVITKSKSSQPVGETAVYLFDDWFDPIEAGVRDRVRGFIQAMIEGELDETLEVWPPLHGRRLASSSGKDDGLATITGHRHGHRSRSLTRKLGRTEIAVPRARLVGADGETTEWKSKVLRTYQRRTLVADALIAVRLLRRAPNSAVSAVRSRHCLLKGSARMSSAGSGGGRRATGTPGTPVRSPRSRLCG